MGDDIGSGLLFMAVCFDFSSTNVVQLSNRNPYLYQFWCHHPLITCLAQSLAKDMDISQIPYIEWFRAYLIFNGQYMVLANDLEGGFKNINAMNKTSQTLDSKTYTEVETHEVETFVRYGNTGCGVFKQGVQI